jgi:hypothetical protein
MGLLASSIRKLLLSSCTTADRLIHPKLVESPRSCLHLLLQGALPFLEVLWTN